MAATMEVECPRCGRFLTIQSDRPVAIEWHDFTPKRGCSGSVIVAAIDVDRITVDGEIIQSWILHSATDEGDRFAGTFHECWDGRGGSSHDRAVIPPMPSPRASSIALDPSESN